MSRSRSWGVARRSPQRELPAVRLGIAERRPRQRARTTAASSKAHAPSRGVHTMPELRSRTVTHGRNMAGARALMRASGVAREDFGKPIIAVANSFTEFVPGPHAPPAGRPDRRRGDPRGGRHPARVQHHRGRRRHRHGPRRHALLPALPRPDRRLRRVHGQGALRRRPDLHLQLRQDHAGHADGRDAAQHPHRLRLRRPDGGRHGHPRRRHRPQARPDQRHRRGRQRQRLRRGHAPHRGRTPARPAAPAPACSPPTR